MSQRTQRIGDLLRAELSTLVQREMRDPRVALATISEVEVTADLRYARVRVSALGEEPRRLETIAALENARGFLRRELAHRLDLRVTPELRFELDRGPEHSQHISDLLATLGTSEEAEGEGDEE
ncbi:MAG: 30S ribosome-binding factor RbfA [Acidobacteria bacterium]|nr:30S ribosome-binding factor RbfA [Acidobacteriota bacterium]MCB9378027.1 30S ribosome-binding factor RbfA [Holophagales bacterium]